MLILLQLHEIKSIQLLLNYFDSIMMKGKRKYGFKTLNVFVESETFDFAGDAFDFLLEMREKH